MGDVLADAAHEDRVLASRLGHGSRVAPGLALVDHHDPWSAGEELAHPLGRDLLPGLDVDGLRVAVEDRHAHGGRVHLDAVVPHDLAGLPDHLHLLFRIPVVEEDVDVRQHVERDLLRIDVRLGRAAVEQRGGLGRELVYRLLAGARNGLVGADVDPLDSNGVVDGLQGDQHLDGRAVRVGDDAAVAVVGDLRRVDLGHDERDVVLVAELGGVVDHDATRGGRLRRVDRRHAGPRGEQADLRAGEVELGQVTDRNVAALKPDRLAGRAAARQGVELAHRELALLQDLDHRLAHCTRRTHHRHVEGPVHCVRSPVQVRSRVPR